MLLKIQCDLSECKHLEKWNRYLMFSKTSAGKSRLAECKMISLDFDFRFRFQFNHSNESFQWISHQAFKNCILTIFIQSQSFPWSCHLPEYDPIYRHYEVWLEWSAWFPIRALRSSRAEMTWFWHKEKMSSTLSIELKIISI